MRNVLVAIVVVLSMMLAVPQVEASCGVGRAVKSVVGAVVGRRERAKSRGGWYLGKWISGKGSRSRSGGC